MMEANRKAIFIDRDGTINVDYGYIKDPIQVELLPAVGEVLAELKQQHFCLIVVSNQSGIGRKIITQEEVSRINREIQLRLQEYGVQLDAMYCCPHTPEDRCGCRKPSPGLILRAAEDHAISLRDSFMIGDKLSDVIAGASVGCKTVLLAPSHYLGDTETAPDFVANDWHEALRYISNPSRGVNEE